MSTVHSVRKRRRRQGAVLAEALVVLSMIGLAYALLSPVVDERAFLAAYGWMAGIVCVACTVGVYVAAQKYFVGRHRFASLAFGVLVSAVAYYVGTSASLIESAAILAVAVAGCVFMGFRSIRRAEQ